MKGLLYSIERFNHLFWIRVQNSAINDEKSVSVFRVITGCFILLIYFPTFSWIEDVPSILFQPPILSLANIASDFPRGGLMKVADLILLFCALGILLGIKARWASRLYVLVSLMAFNFQYSLGKIDHNIMLYALILCMSFSGWGKWLAILPDKSSTFDSISKSMSLFSILLCFGMFTAGFEKALSWIDFDLDTSGFLAWHFTGYNSTARGYLLAPYVGMLPTQVLEIMDYSAIIFELSPIVFLLISRKTWLLWLMIACIFHLLNTALLNIPFIQNFPIYMVFANYRYVFTELNNSFQFLSARIIAIVVLVGIVGIRLYLIIVAIPFPNLIIIFFDSNNKYFGVFIWTVALVILMLSVRNEWYRKRVCSLAIQPHQIVKIN